MKLSELINEASLINPDVFNKSTLLTNRGKKKNQTNIKSEIDISPVDLIFNERLNAIEGGSIVSIKGTVPSKEDLPVEDVKVGDSYVISGDVPDVYMCIGENEDGTPIWKSDPEIEDLTKLIEEKLEPIEEKLNTIEEGAQVNVQADWEQNDDTADDYVKNRTHYISKRDVTIINHEEYIFKPTFNMQYNYGLENFLIEGREYNIHFTYNDIIYENTSTAYKNTLSTSQGNIETIAVDFKVGDTIIAKFSTYFVENDWGYRFYISNINEDITLYNFYIIGYVEDISKLDKKYIPNIYAEIDNMPNYDWNNDEYENCSILNRVCYDYSNDEALYSGNAKYTSYAQLLLSNYNLEEGNVYKVCIVLPSEKGYKKICKYLKCLPKNSNRKATGPCLLFYSDYYKCNFIFTNNNSNLYILHDSPTMGSVTLQTELYETQVKKIDNRYIEINNIFDKDSDNLVSNKAIYTETEKKINKIVDPINGNMPLMNSSGELITSNININTINQDKIHFNSIVETFSDLPYDAKQNDLCIVKKEGNIQGNEIYTYDKEKWYLMTSSELLYLISNRENASYKYFSDLNNFYLIPDNCTIPEDMNITIGKYNSESVSIENKQKLEELGVIILFTNSRAQLLIWSSDIYSNTKAFAVGCLINRLSFSKTRLDYNDKANILLASETEDDDYFFIDESGKKIKLLNYICYDTELDTFIKCNNYTSALNKTYNITGLWVKPGKQISFEPYTNIQKTEYDLFYNNGVNELEFVNKGNYENYSSFVRIGNKWQPISGLYDLVQDEEIDNIIK